MNDKSFQVILLAALIYASFQLVGCSKDVEQKPVEQGAQGISFAVDAVESELSASSGAGRSTIKSTSTGNKPSLKLLQQEVYELKDQPFEVVASIYEENSSTAASSSSNEAKASIGASSAKTTMQNNRKYRVLLFDKDDKFITAMDGTVGVTTPSYAGANRNAKYKWKAYSYDTNADIFPAIPANPTQANFNLANTNVSGLLYASGEITTSNTVNDNNKVNILFKRQTAIIDVVFSGRGMFDKISALVGIANLPIYVAGNFDLKQGLYTSYGSVTNTSVVNTASTVSSKNDTIRTQTFYTINPSQAINSYGVSLSSLTFPTDRGIARTFSSKLNFNFTKSFTPQLGKRYKIIIDFLTTFRNVNNTGGDVDWAYHNLFYNDATKVYGFRHYNSNVYEKGVSAGGSNSGEYFNWKAAKPGNGQNTGVVDPCTLVYPAGRWRMPTTAEFNTIDKIPNGTTQDIRKSNARSADPVRYIDTRLGIGGFPPYDNDTNGLPMLMLGYRRAGSETIAEYNTRNGNPSYLYYWTSNQASVTNNANYFRITNNSSSGSTMSVSNNLNRVKTDGLNIRCVRNRSYVYQPNIN
ncbi:hypothetical protein GQF61_15895 [Sphingobacterium sp. DK4209]|uniref:Fibrobacter succinogenes major paralogous domain-containing protein n=1 Tax=Sphingobacterium zhuxiongii TaxID=2662364 RepID=A0A5Q0Q9Z0_9SPHI|nr:MULTISPECIES: FISUMP domain-containing protein [unclassified Sphingobacterium]MVZ67338.1 hypothetical protein [Sphingobacterium sp. DK4209]QGA26927.1 hypothetical protein GFH32_11645 [Sphingobacterium sp. dk4302]